MINQRADIEKWGIIGIGLMPWDSKMYNVLKSQDTLYTLLSRGNTGSEARIIGSIIDFMFAPDNHQAVIDKVTPPIRTVSCRTALCRVVAHGNLRFRVRVSPLAFKLKPVIVITVSLLCRFVPYRLVMFHPV